MRDLDLGQEVAETVGQAFLPVSCEERLPCKSLAFLLCHAVLRQNILERHNAFQVMHVGAAYDRQDVQLTRAHAVQGHMERVVGMDMRELAGIEDLTQPPVSKTVVVAALQVLQPDDANDSTLLTDGPGLEF